MELGNLRPGGRTNKASSQQHCSHKVSGQAISRALAQLVDGNYFNDLQLLSTPGEALTGLASSPGAWGKDTASVAQRPHSFCSLLPIILPSVDKLATSQG